MTKLPTICFVVVVIASCLGRAAGQDRAEMAQAAVDNMAQETVECAAYFHIVGIALSNSGENETAQQFSDASKKALERADSLSEGIVGARYNATILDMTNKVIVAGINKTIDKSLSNATIFDMAVLDDTYGKLCKEVMSDPPARAQYWMEHAGPAK
jgi:hypothetical protein